MSISNILVITRGGLVSIADWERVTTLPAYAAVKLPQFLGEFVRAATPGNTTDTTSQVYKTELKYYYATCLGKHLLDEITRVCSTESSVFETERIRPAVLI
jgi:hypothetical protein